MARYVMRFSKTGYIIFTSHLDLVRIFKRAFKRAGIALEYSNGYNPHPHMSFALPLPLGYSSYGEILDFRTKDALRPEMIRDALSGVLPEGLDVIAINEVTRECKTMAAKCTSAVYRIEFPEGSGRAFDEAEGINAFMEQERILAEKRMKSKKRTEWVDIKPQIHWLVLNLVDGNIILTTELDAGSSSHLSPELLIQAFLSFYDLSTCRYEIDVVRLELRA